MIKLLKQYKENQEVLYKYLLEKINIITFKKETNKNSNSFNWEYEVFINTQNNNYLFNTQKIYSILEKQYDIEKNIIEKEKKYLLNNIKKINKKEEWINKIIEEFNLNISEIKTILKYWYNLITLDINKKIKLNKKVLNNIKEKIENVYSKEILKENNSILEINIVQNIEKKIKEIINYNIYKDISVEKDFFREKIVIHNYIKTNWELNSYINSSIEELNKNNLKFKELKLLDVYSIYKNIETFIQIKSKEDFSNKKELQDLPFIEIWKIELLLSEILDNFNKNLFFKKIINKIKKNIVKDYTNNKFYKILVKQTNFMEIIFVKKITKEDIHTLIQNIFNKDTQILIKK